MPTATLLKVPFLNKKLTFLLALSSKQATIPIFVSFSLKCCFADNLEWLQKYAE